MTLYFSRALKLNSPKEFKSVRRTGRKLVVNGIRAYSQKNQLVSPRLGLVIAKREIPKAVTRNYVKRIIREGFRLNQHYLTNVDIIVFVHKQALAQEKWHFQDCINKLWQKLSVYCENQPSF